MARFLVLTCSLVFLLPQGWCCLFAGSATASTTAATPANTAGHCPCCRHNVDPNSSPTDKPAVPATSICPCADRHATLPTPSTVPPVDTAFVVLLPLNSELFSVALPEANAARLHHTPTRQLHVFECVWLC